MKYNVGDRVRIKSLDWYNENKNEYGNVEFSTHVFVPRMSKYCGMIVTIEDIFEDTDGNVAYYMDGIDWDWTDEMIECKVEKETKFGTASNPIEPKSNANCIIQSEVDVIEKAKTYWDSIKDAWVCPDGYIFKDENGNVINATKIVLEKKKKEYPKTYEECCKVLGVNPDNFLSIRNLYRDDGDEESTDYERDLLGKFDSLWELRICRDAYWKIAGEEIGLGKPWEPDWDAKDNHFYTIYTFNGKIECSATAHRNAVLIFPTEEMRDAFYENFKELIEQCKELL